MLFRSFGGLKKFLFRLRVDWTWSRRRCKLGGFPWCYLGYLGLFRCSARLSSLSLSTRVQCFERHENWWQGSFSHHLLICKTRGARPNIDIPRQMYFQGESRLHKQSDRTLSPIFGEFMTLFLFSSCWDNMTSTNPDWWTAARYNNLTKGKDQRLEGIKPTPHCSGQVVEGIH